MKRIEAKELVFMALCCDLGLFSKRMIAPFANIVTDSLHIPGGIGTCFSLMFVVMARSLVNRNGVATLMSIVQAIIALVLGMTGSMGALSPIGYIIPGIVIDCIFYIFNKINRSSLEKCVYANAIGALFASLSANIIVFHLSGVVLIFYGTVSFTSGMLCGVLGDYLLKRLCTVIKFKREDANMNTKKSFKTIILLTAIILLGVGGYYFTSRKPVEKNTIEIQYLNENKEVVLDDLTLEDIKGETINGKGDVNQIEAKGISIAALLNHVDISTYEEIKVVADDEYSANVKKEEIEEEHKVYLLIDNGNATLLVFGDQNSKRNVRNVVKVVVE